MQYSGQAGEYTPELLGDFYSRLARPVREETAANIGNLRGSLLKRGLTGTPMEALGTAYTQSAGANKLADLMANLNWQKAGMQREERLGEVERDWKSQEAEKERAFRERLAELERKWAKEDRPNFFEQTLGNLAGTAGTFGLAKLLLPGVGPAAAASSLLSSASSSPQYSPLSYLKMYEPSSKLDLGLF